MATKNLISIDLETLDVSDSSVILAIGIAVGDTEGNVTAKFQVFPSIEEQLKSGRTVLGSTLMWWFDQDDGAREEQSKAKRLPVAECIQHVKDFFAAHSGFHFVLGNAPSFDCDMLGDFLGGKLWEFYHERDVRTARMKVPMEDRAPNHAEHSALADAIAQLQDFATFYRM